MQPVANNQNPNPLMAALYRFAAAFISLVFVVVVLIFFTTPPEVKVILIGLGGAAVLAIEEYLKSQAGL